MLITGVPQPSTSHLKIPTPVDPHGPTCLTMRYAAQLFSTFSQPLQSTMFFNLCIVTSLMCTFTSSQNALRTANNLNASAPYGVTWILGQLADPAQLDPAGYDFTGTLYVSRARINGQWVPGKGFYNGKTFYTVVGYDGGERLSGDNQALLRGNTRWIAVQKNGNIPSSAVVAGIDPRSRQPEYVCRGFVFAGGKPLLIVGKYVQDLTACRVAYYGETPVNSFEILVEVCNGKK